MIGITTLHHRCAAQAAQRHLHHWVELWEAAGRPVDDQLLLALVQVMSLIGQNPCFNLRSSFRLCGNALCTCAHRAHLAHCRTAEALQDLLGWYRWPVAACISVAVPSGTSLSRSRAGRQQQSPQHGVECIARGGVKLTNFCRT